MPFGVQRRVLDAGFARGGLRRVRADVNPLTVGRAGDVRDQQLIRDRGELARQRGEREDARDGEPEPRPAGAEGHGTQW